MLAVVVATQCFHGVHAQEHQHPRLAQDADAFHEVLAPLWHASPGLERTRNTCSKVGEMESRAKAIRSTDAAALVASIGTLRTKCQAEPPEIDAAFAAVHDAFHHLGERRMRE